MGELFHTLCLILPDDRAKISPQLSVKRGQLFKLDMFAATLSDAPQWVTDGEDYLAALEMFWQQINSQNMPDADRLLTHGGWIDGCGA